MKKELEIFSTTVDMDKVEVSLVQLAARFHYNTKRENMRKIGTALKDFLTCHKHACSCAIKIAEMLFRTIFYAKEFS